MAANAATKQARAYASDAKASPTEVSSILEQRIRGVQEEAGLAETGRVLSVGYVGFESRKLHGMVTRFDLATDSFSFAAMVLLVCMV